MFYGSRHNISETLLKLALNTYQSISKYFNLSINILWSYGCIKPLSTILFILFRWNLNATELKSPTNFISSYSSTPLHVTDFYVDIKSTTTYVRALTVPYMFLSVITFQNDTIQAASFLQCCIQWLFGPCYSCNTFNSAYPNIIVVSSGTDISRNHTKSDSWGLLNNITGHQFIIIVIYTTTLETQDLEYHDNNWHHHCQVMTV